MRNMTYNAFILIPGARWPEPEARRLWNELSEAERSMLSDFGLGAEEPVHQFIAPHPFTRAPHLVWGWRVFAQRPGAPVTAPYAWMADGGPQQHAELWRIERLRVETGRIEGIAPIDDRNALTALITLSPIVEKAGWRLQWSGRSLYAVVKTPVDASAAPAVSLTGLALEALETMRVGTEADVLAQLSAALSEKAQDGCFYWLEGGGVSDGALTPTKIRAVAADEPAFRGWAEQAGLLRSRTTALAQGWAVAPKGDLIALIDHLWAPWLAGDTEAWRRMLPKAHAAFMRFADEAKSEARDAAPAAVLMGAGTASTLMPKNTPFIAFFGRNRRVDPLTWLIDGDAS